VRGSVFKRLLVVSLSLGVFVFDQIHGLWFRLLGRGVRARGVVLTYHSIPPAHRIRFAKQLDILGRLAVPVRADSRCRTTGTKGCVAVTFDDGLTSFAENAWPELDKRGIPAAVFVVADTIGKVPDWVNYTPGSMPTERTLSLDQLRSLPDSVMIGSHSLTHQLLTDLCEADSFHEIQASRCRLESVLQRRIDLFSFPYGECSDELIEQCERAGYARVFTSLPQLAFSQPDEFVTGRVDVQPTEWSIEFRLKVVGAYRWLPYAFDVKRAILQVFTR
jgi:peptidoglycan/xylan/chitin deacetylase (PgdA/CDA1 family)